MQFFSLKNFLKALLFITVLGSVSYYIIGKIQDRNNIMSFEDYNPPSSLVVPENILTRAKFPFVDVHNHQFDNDLVKLMFHHNIVLIHLF